LSRNNLFNNLFDKLNNRSVHSTLSHALSSGSKNSKTSIFQRFLAYRKRNPITYIPHFPYTKKTDFQEFIPIWKQRKDIYTKYKIPLDYIEPCVAIQDKKTGIVYNLYLCNMMQDDYKAGVRDYEHFSNVIIPNLKKYEKDLDYTILGWDEGYLKPSLVKCSDKFRLPGDQFLQFFEEKDSYYYYAEPVYPIDYAEDTVEELTDDYLDKHIVFWEDRNLTDDNLGSANRNHWI